MIFVDVMMTTLVKAKCQHDFDGSVLHFLALNTASHSENHFRRMPNFKAWVQVRTMTINVVFISYHFHVKSRCGGSYPIPRSSPWTQQEYSEKMVVGGLGWEKSIASVESVSGNEIEVGQCQHGQLGYNSFLIRDQLTHLHWIRMDERSATFAWKYIKSYEIDVHGKQIGNVCMKLHLMS